MDLSIWQSEKIQGFKQHYRFPDFIIGGAQKSGTTSLHHILAHHERIFIPQIEVLFWSLNDYQEHPLLPHEAHQTDFHYLEDTPEEALNSYAAKFQEACDDQIVGEDSTTYLSSKLASKRLNAFLPETKLIFILRDPVSRAYSHYWHQLPKNRNVFNFKDSIHQQPNLIRRSQYREHLERYYQLFPKENIKVIIFEQFLKEMQQTIDNVLRFLGLETNLDIDRIPTHYNRARIPRFPVLQTWFNRTFVGEITRQERRQRHAALMNTKTPAAPENQTYRVTEKIHRKINPLLPHKYPPIDPEIRHSLEDFFAHENAGLSDLIQIDVGQYWKYMAK